jgi:hypothetical protein
MKRFKYFTMAAMALGMALPATLSARTMDYGRTEIVSRGRAYATHYRRGNDARERVVRHDRDNRSRDCR